MKYVDEYRDGATAQGYARAIARQVTRPWTIMEIGRASCRERVSECV